jgi:hypothetical protein
MAVSPILQAVLLMVLLATPSWEMIAEDAGGKTPADQSSSCREYLEPLRMAGGQPTGQADCVMVENRVRLPGGPSFVRLDIGLTGKAEGYVVLTGRRSSYFTTAPELFFPQTGNPRPWHLGIVEYRAERGIGVTILYPADPARWNGKMFFTAHGAGRAFHKGNLKPWQDRFDPADIWGDISRYERLMLEKGYALATSRRSSDKVKGDCTVVLEDSKVLENRNIMQTPHLLLEFALLSERILAARLGREPRRTYWYGHSAGARVGRSINYLPGLNRLNGRPIIDGILADDSATGLWLPVLYRDGEDVLLASDEARRQFVPQIDVTHLLYIRLAEDPMPDWISKSYLLNKRENARILREKGLNEKHRMYEVRGVSHSGGEYLTDEEAAASGVLPLWRLMESLIERLDEWVERGIPPPATRSDWVELGDHDGDGRVEKPAIALPEVACPLGVYHPYPLEFGEKGVGTTGFATFAGESLEPLDGRGVFVDMNRNGYQDVRETVTGAWRRLGLLGEDELFTRDRYVACVEGTVHSLRSEGLLSESRAEHYVENARFRPLPAQR